MNVLLTSVGLHDPYSMGADGAEYNGPILSLLNEKKFDKIILFGNKFVADRTQEIAQIIKERHQSFVDIRNFEIDDPTDYLILLKEMRWHIQEISDNGAGKQKFYISVTSGTPHMHVCWFLLVASGEIPAKIINVRPPKYVSTTSSLVTEIDYSNAQFPKIIYRTSWVPEFEEEAKAVETVMEAIGIIGDHPSFKKCIKQAADIAVSDLPVIIMGETGTGKELIAHFIHKMSGRAQNRFTVVNCASLQENLVESILFGYKKGAYTGAVTDHQGKFEYADNGTIFLDELGELPLSMQAKLLRVLEEKSVEPLGDNKPRKINVRVVCATNRNLKDMVKEGKFREDLYYRLNVGEIELPALRERKSDIPKIALYILNKINGERKMPKTITPEALLCLQNMEWKGNIRDLKNTIERTTIFTKKNEIGREDIYATNMEEENVEIPVPDPYEGFSMEDFLSRVREKLIKRALEKAHGNQSRAARLLAITPQAVNKFFKEG